MTESEPSPKAKFTQFLSRFPAATIALVNKSLPKLRKTFPGTIEMVYDYANSVVISFSLSGRGYEGIVALSIDARRVRLCFLDGKQIPDPKGLLEGSATRIRTLTLESASDLDSKDVQALMKAAIKHSGLKFPRGRPTTMMIQSETKKKAKAKAKKTKRA